MDLEPALLEIMRGEKKVPLVSAGLTGLSAVYRCIIAMRNTAYDCRMLPTVKLPIPIISVGNCVVGGTGKTPLVHLLATLLQDKVRLGILSRGFRSRIERTGRNEQISSGTGPLFSAEECGDEPFFLAQKTRASIWVGADRALSGHKALAQGINCLLLDDGMQHRRLHRDVEIAVVDAKDPFSRDKFLPAGLLRDSPKRLKNATLIAATAVEDQEHFVQVQQAISRYSSAPVIGTNIEVHNTEQLLFKKVGVFCGIGSPSRFLQTVRDLKSQIIDTLIVKDHGSLRNDRLEKFANHCHERGAEALLCTEKDYVKLSPDLSLKLNIVPVKIGLKVVFGKEHWEQLIDNILQKVNT